MNTNHTLIVVLLDASGSMHKIKQPMLAGLNSFILTQQNMAYGCGVDRPIDLSPDLSGPAVVLTANFTLATFASTAAQYRFGSNDSYDNHGEPKDYDYSYNLVYDNADIHTVTPLTDTQYDTAGGTPLIDALYKTIEDTKRKINLMPDTTKPGRVIMVVVTDGEENSSKKYKRDQLNTYIKTQTDVHNWQFVFLGANQDAIAEATATGMAAANSMTYAANDQGITQAFNSTGNLIRSKRAVSYDKMCSTSYAAADYTTQDKILGSQLNASHFTSQQPTVTQSPNVNQLDTPETDKYLAEAKYIKP